MELFGISIRKELSWKHLEDKMAKDAGKRLSLMKKSVTLLEHKPAGYDFQEHGEIQDGIRLVSIDGILRNSVRQT